MVTHQNQELGSVETSPSKDSVKRALNGTELIDPTKTKLQRVENGVAHPTTHTTTDASTEDAQFGEGEIEVAIVDDETGAAIDLASLSGVELFSLIKDEIEKLSSKFTTSSAFNNFRLASLITEDEKSALIKLFEIAQAKFNAEFDGMKDAIHPPMWFACYAMTKLLFAQVMNHADIVSETLGFFANKCYFPNADPSQFVLQSLIHLNELVFSFKRHSDSFCLRGDNAEAENQTLETSLPSEVSKHLQDVDDLMNKFSEALVSSQTCGVDMGVSRRLFIEWVETLWVLFSFDALLFADKVVAPSALEMLAKALEAVGATLFSSIASEALSFVNSLFYKVFVTYGTIYPHPIKTILLAADRFSQTFLDSNEGSFGLFSSFGHLSLALSKQIARDATPEVDTTERVAEFYAKGIECFERALEFKKDAALEAYLSELNGAEASGEVPEYFALFNSQAIADDAQDADFVPNEEEVLDNEENIVVDPAEEDLSEGVEDEDVPLEQIPEVTMEPGQAILEGTRSTSKFKPILLEDEDEETDPDFVPRVSDVEEELGQSEVEEDTEDEACLPEDESASEDKLQVREDLEVPVSILAAPELLEDEPEEADPEFIPHPQEVEAELSASGSEDELNLTAHAEEHTEDEDEDDESFLPSAQEESDNEETVEEEDESEAAE